MGELIRIPVEGMTCTSCVSHITKAVRKIDGIESVKVDLGSESAIVGFDDARTSLTAIAAAITHAGYEPHPELVAPFSPTAPRGILERLGLGRGSKQGVGGR
jgi:copper ion binding protein